MKDFELYRAAYCGVCKGIGASCGQMARWGLSYDATFISLLLHNIMNIDIEVEKQSCITKFGFKHPMAKVDELTKNIGCLNTILAYYKLLDDVADEKKGGVKRFFFVGSFKKAKKLHPQMAEIVERNMKLQSQLEKGNSSSVDMAADPTATMLQELSRYLLGEFATEHTDGLFYDVGKWIYLIDAVDDYDKDVKKKSYNPFFSAYGAESKERLISDYGNDLQFIFNTLFFDIRERLSQIKFYFNRDLTDNILLRGLPKQTQEIMSKTSCEKKCKKGE